MAGSETMPTHPYLSSRALGHECELIAAGALIVPHARHSRQPSAYYKPHQTEKTVFSCGSVKGMLSGHQRRQGRQTDRVRGLRHQRKPS